MITKHLLSLLLCGSGLLVLAGCGTPVNTVEPARPQASMDVVPDKRIVMDGRLEKRVHVEYVNQANGDNRAIQATVHNQTRHPFQFQYQWEWFDSDGMVIPTPSTTWSVRRIEGGETLSLSTAAPTPRAVDFRLKLMTYTPQ